MVLLIGCQIKSQIVLMGRKNNMNEAQLNNVAIREGLKYMQEQFMNSVKDFVIDAMKADLKTISINDSLKVRTDVTRCAVDCSISYAMLKACDARCKGDAVKNGLI
jgi:hypothetical protein